MMFDAFGVSGKLTSYCADFTHIYSGLSSCLNPSSRSTPTSSFSTKERRPFLRDDALRVKTHAYLAGICNHQASPAMGVGGVEDHVHILCRLSKTLDLASLIRELKRDSSKWIKDQDARQADFAWQSGYGAFSVSPSHLDRLQQYIANQRAHHEKETYQDEMRRIAGKYGAQLDERYAWD